MTDKPVKKPGRMKLRNVRLSYPHLDKPHGFAGDQDRAAYSANFITQPSDEEFDANRAAIKKAVAEAMREKWGSNPPKIKRDRRFYTTLEEDDDDNFEPGSILVRARSKARPVLVSNQRDENGKWIRIEDEEEIRKVFYAGCRVNATVTVWCLDHPEYGRRISCALDAVQFRAHDKRLGGSVVVDPDDVFDEDDVPEVEVADDDFDDDGDDVI